MEPDLAPTACLPFEPEEARCLHWLPLAVRHKLDACGLRLSLAQWQALDLADRRELLRSAPGQAFAFAAERAGAVADRREAKPQRLEAAQVAQGLGCGAEAARAWLEAASPFARYACAKLLKAGETIGA